MRALAWITASLVLTTSCQHKSSSQTKRAVVTASADAGKSAPKLAARLAPLRADSWRIELPVSGFLPASVAVPLGASEPRPIIIALHGSGDRADWQCGAWRGIAGPHPFILCPAGSPVDKAPKDLARFGFKNLPDTERELRAALTALKQRFGKHVAPGSVILAGFSLGAIYGARIARQEPSFFSRLVLIEGGYGDWSAGDAGAFVKRGGQGFLVVCAQAACTRDAARAVLFTKRAGADAELIYPGPIGHQFDGRVASAIKERYSWFVSADARFLPGGAVKKP